MSNREENMMLWNAVRQVPEEAKKQIIGGRLRGMTDINPVWRIQVMTEQFGPCGFGWKYKIVNLWTVPAGDEILAFAHIELQYKLNGEWSEPVPGTGGSGLLNKETKGLVSSDECFKMAITDAISVAAKSLGIAADVYFAKGAKFATKYEMPDEDKQSKAKAKVQPTSAPQPQPAPAPQPAAPQVPMNVLAEINAAMSKEELAAIKAKYANEPFASILGNFLNNRYKTLMVK